MKNKSIRRTSKSMRTQSIEESEIPQELKSFFIYRHNSLNQYCTDKNFKTQMDNIKRDYFLTFENFKKNIIPEKKDAVQDNQTKAKPSPSNGKKKTTKSNNPQNSTKKFICTGGYKDICDNLIKRGWTRNKNPKSTDFEYIWTLKINEINFSILRPEQMTAHFYRNGAITRKVGLCKNIRNLYYKGIDPNNFFPRCYDLSNKNDTNDFIEDFKTNRAISIIRKIYDLITDTNNPININNLNLTTKAVKTAIDIAQRKLNIFTGEYDVSTITKNKNSNIITEDEWKIIREEEDDNTKTKENQAIKTLKEETGKSSAISNLGEAKTFTNIKSTNGLNKKLNELKLNQKKKSPQTIIAEKDTPITLGQIGKLKSTITSLCEKIKNKTPQYELNGNKNIWIVKPANLSRGRGIFCTKKLTQIKKAMEETSTIIVQKYIENPLIIMNRKFDIRQWVLVTSLNPLTIWMWMEPYVRFGAEDYNINDLNNIYAHLTNNSIGKHSEKFNDTKIEGNMWEINQLREFLIREYSKDSWPEIHEKFKKVIINSLDCTRHEIVQRKNSHELYGYDFMIDKNLNVYLIEVNSSPAMDYSTKITEKLVKEMLENLLQVVIDHKDDSDSLDQIGKYKRIYKGQEVDKTFLPNTSEK